MSESIEVTIKYPRGHSYTFKYERDEVMYCPDCGVLGRIWYQADGGDYYVGERHFCGACATSFTIQESDTIKREDYRFVIIRAIRAAS